jgi:hypothetical protein
LGKGRRIGAPPARYALRHAGGIERLDGRGMGHFKMIDLTDMFCRVGELGAEFLRHPVT